MFIFDLLKKILPKKALKVHGLLASQKNVKVDNQLEIAIGDILVRIIRRTTIPPQNELTAVIPRAEIRLKRYQDGQLVIEKEVILNSITLVDSPLHPPVSSKTARRTPSRKE